MRFDTKTLHGGHNPAESKNCIPTPLYMTTAFSFDDVKYAADLFDLKVSGDIYTRISNPTTAVLETRIAKIVWNAKYRIINWLLYICLFLLKIYVFFC